jgi:hypothetical protein
MKKGRPVTISLRKIGLYRNQSKTPMTDFMETVCIMEKIANLEDENKRLKAQLKMKENT